ncbi:MAG TPA: hypothetical protein VFD70_07870 [Anaerolineae bacterium]|nr:hypothetical protein [Anaerolineae bacterium]
MALRALSSHRRKRVSNTTKDGTVSQRYPPPRYAWADPAYDVVHASIVPANANILRALLGKGPAETTGEDNLKTVRLVFGAYESAAKNQVVTANDEQGLVMSI